MNIRGEVRRVKGRIDRLMYQYTRGHEVNAYNRNRMINLSWKQHNANVAVEHTCFWPRCGDRVVRDHNGRVKRKYLDRLRGANRKLNDMIIRLLNRYDIQLKFTCKFSEFGDSLAFYNWSSRRIEIKQPERFIRMSYFYRTLLHELAHAMHAQLIRFHDFSVDAKEVVAETAAAVVLEKYMKADTVGTDAYTISYLMDDMDFHPRMEDQVTGVTELLMEAA